MILVVNNQLSKVEHSNSLSETLGLYYIAKAERIPGGIDSTAANSLGKYFISQSSLKNLDDSLMSSIIKVIATNDNVYNLITNISSIDGKNYSTNYIFDSNNNLIQVYYYKWDNNEKTKEIGYSWKKDYRHESPYNSSSSYLLFNWQPYAKNWNEFVILYPQFNLSLSSLFIQSDDGHQNDLQQLSANTDKILTNDNNSVFEAKVSNGSDKSATLDLYIWHDSENILFKWIYYAHNCSCLISILVDKSVFENLMN
ncbi:hypothetical protein [Spiroplasma sp. AdecLV25b]|uniref:hypothetical protein n=1 Tax=Spiroplasma sp. AdecLV25b TaxID=3027162 RepID=UPI0027E1A6E1|nr:hypothetical protein [Spiroplasma sp. AdecLV25b]